MRILKIIMVVLGVVIATLSIRSLIELPGTVRILEEAVSLDEPVVTEENEGRMVIVSGTVEMTRPAYDEELDLTLQTVKAYRYDQQYARASDGEEEKYDWISRGTQTILGEAALGEFELDEKLLMGFATDAFCDEFDPEEIGSYVTDQNAREGDDRTYVLSGADYYYDSVRYDSSASDVSGGLSRSVMTERIGAWAYSYQCWDASRHETMTIAGIQQGNTLVAHEKIGPVIYDGSVSREELVNAHKGYGLWGSLAFLAIALVLIFFGLRKSGKNKKRKKA